MKRFLLCLVPWMVTGLAAASDAPRPAAVSFTYAGLARDLVWRVGDECHISPPIALRWGWNTSIAGENAIVLADGRRIEVKLGRIGNTPTLPLRAILKALDAESSWRPGTDVLDVYGVIRSATIDDGKFTADATLATKPRITHVDNPRRVVVDLPGMKLRNDTMIALGPKAKVLQQPDGVRMILETNEVVSPGVAQNPSRRFEYSLKTGFSGTPSTVDLPVTAISGEASESVGTAAIAPPDVLTVPPVAPAYQGPKAGPLERVTESGSSALFRIRLPAGAKEAPRIARPDPLTIQITVPKCKFEGDSPQSESLASVAVEQIGADAVLTLTLVRPMGLEVATVGGEMQLQLLKPAVGDGKLAGKIIVVDAGHGGGDSGARSPAKDVSEKNLNLAISKLLAQKLAAQGATVVMTRKTDVAVDLKERPEIANRNKADFFVSVHINSNTTGKSSGGMTFYHLQDPISSVLALCIQKEIAKVSRIPNMGTRSDRSIYTNGFAVLRGAKMPAVLLELGFINHAADRARMVTPEFQEAVATAVVKGIKVYLGDGKTQEE